MRNLVVIIALAIGSVAYAQSKETKFEKVGDLVKATYYYDNGKIKTEGFFKDKKLTGKWVSYNKAGVKTSIANYEAGKKVGKWIVWTKNGIKEIIYDNNIVQNVKVINEDTGVAINNE